jgi:NitT/TauT family transport system substrate-binding protein
MQSEPQASQVINKGFGVEVLKPYDTPIGSPVRATVMTEQFYGTRKPAAEKFMRCFVQATETFIADPALASKYVRGTLFKGQITLDDFEDAIGNAPYSCDITAGHIQVITDTMAKTGVGRMRQPPVARDWVRTELLAAAKKSLNVN